MERGPKGGFEAGQPVDTDDAMNDMPENKTAADIFAQRMQERVADGTYTQEEADALIAKAQAKHEEKVQSEAETTAYNAWANMTPDEAAAKSDAMENEFAGETNLNSKTGKERTEGTFDLYPRMAGESNEEYSARLAAMKEATAKFAEENPEPEAPKAPETAFDSYKEMVEKRVESGDLKREDADEMIARREEQVAEKAENAQKVEDYNEAQEKAKMEMAERIRKEVPEALEFLEKHPELKTEMTAAVKKLEELEEIANIKEGADKAVDAELVKRNETFMKAVEAFNVAARANEAARAKMKELEERSKKGDNVSDEEFAKAEEEIHESEKVMAAADADKKNAESEYNAVEAAIRGDAEKRTNELNARINERDKYVEEERDYYNRNFAEANGDAEKIAELKQDQVEAADVMEEWVDRGLGKTPEGEGVEGGKDAEVTAKHDFKVVQYLDEDGKNVLDTNEIGGRKYNLLKADGVIPEDATDEEAQDIMSKIRVIGISVISGQPIWEPVNPDTGDESAGNESAGEKDEDKEHNAFVESYLNDPDWRKIYVDADGNFDEARCRAALEDMWAAKKAEDAKAAAKDEAARAADVQKIMNEDAGEKAGEEADDGFENENQRGLFNKIKGFFNRNKRVKAGAEKALENGGVKGWKKVVLAGMLALLAGTQLANFMPNLMNNQNAMNSAGGGVAIEEVQAKENEEASEEKQDLKDIADNLSLEVDLNAEKGEELSDLINTKYSDGTDLEINLSYGDYEGSAFFEDGKDGVHNFTPWLYDHETEGLTEAQIAKQIQENLNQLADDPVLQGQMASLMGADLTVDGKSVTSFEGMRDVQTLAQSDDEFRIKLADAVKDINRELAGYTLDLETVKQGQVYSSLYAVNVAEDGEQPRIVYFKDTEVTAKQDFKVERYLDDDAKNVLDTNEIGGRKYNALKAGGEIPEDATDEEAQDIMSKIRVIGISGKCGQLIWVPVNPDTGSEPDTGTENEPDTGTENEPDTGTENEPDTGTENEPDTGTENEPDTGTEIEPDTGTEVEPDTGTEVEPDTGTEIEPDTGTEIEDDDGKTDVLPGNPDDGWDQINHPTEEETGPTDEASRTPVDEGGNGYVNDETPGSSSNLAEDNFLNGGDQGGGNTDADGGGSTNSDTEATYDGSDTSGYDNGAQQETGTQTVEEPSTPEEVNQVNDSEANPDSAGEDQAPGEGAAEAMDRLG